jgi:phage minor structural protein
LTDLIVTDLNGQSELLTDYKNLRRKRRVNGEHSLSFLLVETDGNTHSFNLAKEESIIELDGQEYRIKKAVRKPIGKRIVKQIEAHHVLFDLIDNRIYTKTTGSKTIQQALDFALAGSGFTYSVIDAFGSADLGEFGDDNSLALLNVICDTFNAEVDENNRHLTFRTQVGTDAGVQIRRGYNLKTIEESVNSSNLSTYIKGYGKENEDGTYAVQAEYTSPNAAVFGIRHADPIQDSKYTSVADLTARLQKSLIDTPEVSITLTFADLKKAGYPFDTIGKGDVVYVIDEILGIDYPARVLEIEDSPDETDPSGMSITVSNYKKDIRDYVADFEKVRKEFKGIVNESGKVRYNVLDEAVKIATEALTNSLTELEYPVGQGIIARDKTNPNKLTVLRSSGFGISKDGGQTFTDAITADGFVLSVGAIGQLKANNIDVDGLIVNTLLSQTGPNSNTVKVFDGVAEFKHPNLENGVVPIIKFADNGYYTGDILVNRQNGNISLSAPRKGTTGTYGDVYLGYVNSTTSNRVIAWGRLDAAAGLDVAFGGLASDGPINAYYGLNVSGMPLNVTGQTISTDRSVRATSPDSEMESFIFKANPYTSYFQALSSAGMRVQNFGRSGYLPVYASEFSVQTSFRDLKTDIQPLDSGLDVVNSTSVVNYRVTRDLYIYDEEENVIGTKPLEEVPLKTGVIIEDTDPRITNGGTSVDLYSMISYAYKGIQEVDDKADTNALDIKSLLNEINSLKERVSILEANNGA